MTTNGGPTHPGLDPEQTALDGSLTVNVTLPGFLPMPPLEIGVGVSVITGINNVGKTRLLRHLHSLRVTGASYTLGDLDVTIRSGDETGVLRVRPVQTSEVGNWTVSRAAEVVWDDVVVRSSGGGQFERRSRLPALARSSIQGSRGPNFPSLAWMVSGRPLALNTRLPALTMIDAQRVVLDLALTQRVTEVTADGSNLGQVLYTHLNDRTPAFSALERIMHDLFPEVGGVLTVPAPSGNQVRLTLRDRFSHHDVPLSECGTGVAQMLYFVAIVLMAPPGRIFLVDEPHVYLHAQAERALARFLRAHPEHSYVVATHSPVFIDAVDPDRLWHLTRDEHGTAVRDVLPHDPEPRREMFRALGWRPSQFAWAERVLFVEGDSDAQVYPMWFARWGWSSEVVRCPVVDIGGADGKSVAQRIAEQLSRFLSLDACVLLDGDKKGASSDRSCLYLPVSDLEAVLLRDLEAVRTVLLEYRAQATGEPLDDLLKEWPVARLETVMQEKEDPAPKGAWKMSRLAQTMSVRFKKTVHGPLIAQRMDLAQLDDIRVILEPFVTGQGNGVP